MEVLNALGLLERLAVKVDELEARLVEAEANALDALDMAVDEPLAVHELGDGMKTSQFVFGGSGSGGSSGLDFPFKISVEGEQVRVRGGRVWRVFVDSAGAVWNAEGGTVGTTIVAGTGWSGSVAGGWVSEEIKSDCIGLVYNPPSAEEDGCYTLEWLGGTGGVRGALVIGKVSVDEEGTASVAQYQMGDLTQTLTQVPSPLMVDGYGKVVQQVGVWRRDGSGGLVFSSDSEAEDSYSYADSGEEMVLSWNGVDALEAKKVQRIFGAQGAGFALRKQSLDGVSGSLTYTAPVTEDGFGELGHKPVSLTFWSDTEPTIGSREALLYTAIEDANAKTTYENGSGA